MVRFSLLSFILLLLLASFVAHGMQSSAILSQEKFSPSVGPTQNELRPHDFETRRQELLEALEKLKAAHQRFINVKQNEKTISSNYRITAGKIILGLGGFGLGFAGTFHYLSKLKLPAKDAVAAGEIRNSIVRLSLPITLFGLCLTCLGE